MNITPEHLRELATKYRLAMLRLGANDADFRACGIELPTEQERTAIEEKPTCTCLCPSGDDPLGHSRGCPLRDWLEADTGTGEGER
jgi:hypothetical protein